jgi:hypothetical protein
LQAFCYPLRGEVFLPCPYPVSFSIKRRHAVIRFRIAVARLRVNSIALPLLFFRLLIGVFLLSFRMYLL